VELGVWLKSWKDSAGVVVVEELTAELEVELVAE
jgi:hypothetical protein